MQVDYFTCRATRPSAATMIRISTGLRNMSVRAVMNTLVLKQVPPLASLSSTDYHSSAIALRERKENLSFTDRSRNPAYTSPARSPLLDVSAGGGPRPKKPRVWRTKTKKGSIARSEKLIDLVGKLSNTKEEIYGALDAWIAWDLEFPLIAVKKALKTLKDQEEWRRIIQLSKWMLDKGQGKTLATYQLLLQAFDHEGRIEEADVLWEKVLRDNMECIPRMMFSQMITMYDRHDKKKELLKVYADMEELQVKPDRGTVEKVARAYSHFGYHEVAQAVLTKETAREKEFIFKKGKIRVVNRQSLKGKEEKPEAEASSGLQNNRESQDMSAAGMYRKSTESPRLDTSNEQEGPTMETASEPQELPRLETNNKSEESSSLVTGNSMEARPSLDTSNLLEERVSLDTNVVQDTLKSDSSTQVKEMKTFASYTNVNNDKDLTPTLR